MITPEIGLREQILETAKSLFIQSGYHGLDSIQANLVQ